MLTPAFELCQDDEFVTVLIRTPYVKLSDVEFYIDRTEFKFYVKPYFLRLNLPGEIVEDGREGATFNVEKGTFTVKLPKLQQGKFFEGLDMLTTLLAPRKKTPVAIKPLIELAGEDMCSTSGECLRGSSDENASEGNSDDSFDWEIEQNLETPLKDDLDLSLGKVGYGFANQTMGVFNGREAELHEIAEIRDPEVMTMAERKAAQQLAEDTKFDEDYYLADYFSADQIQPLLDYTPPWAANYLKWKQTQKNVTQGSSNSVDFTVQFTEEEKDRLRRLPNKEYLFDDKEELPLFFGLVDIVFAYCYNHRTTEGENTVESQWTISRISSTFSWFESFNSLHDVMICCARRTMCYPLYRHWSLVTAALEDTKKIFLLGRQQLLKCLLEIHALFCDVDPWYLLNDLYVTDYCVWIQRTSCKKLSSLTKSLQQIQVKKSDMGWQLDELEIAARLVEQEEKNQEGDNEICCEDESDDSESTDTESEGTSSSSEHNSDNRTIDDKNNTELSSLMNSLNLEQVNSDQERT